MSFDEFLRKLIGAVVCLSVAFLPPILVAQQRYEWPQFLGPGARATVESDRLPLFWSDSQNIRWTTPTRGLGWSSPVVADDCIFITAGIEDENEIGLFVQCFDVHSGKLRFERELFRHAAASPAIHKKNSHASPTPIVDQGRLFVHFGHQGTACLTLNGEVVWTNQEHRYQPVHGNGSTPLLFDGKLIITCDGAESPYTVALEASSGNEVWRTPRGIDADRTFSFCTPTVIEVNGEHQVISVGANLIQSLDPADGRIIWFARFEGFSVIPRPLFHEGLVIISTGYERPETLAFDPTGTGDVTETHLRWRAVRGAPNTPSMLAFEDTVLQLSDNGILSALHAKSGRELWRKRLGGSYSATPLLAGNRLYTLAEDGEAIALELLSDAEPKELARSDVEGRAFASFAVVGDDLILRSERALMRIGNP